MLMVRSGQGNSLALSPVERLQQRVNDTFYFTDFLSVVACLGDSVELVKKQDATITVGKIEQCADVARGRAEERRYETIEPHFYAWQAKLARQVTRQLCFADTWRPVD